MKKFILVAVAVLVSMASAGAQTTKVSDRTSVDGKTYVTTATRTSKASSDVETPFNWENAKDGVSHKIYLHKYSKGDKVGQWTAYVLKTSKKTGKEYKYYLPDGEAIAQDIIKRNPNIIK